LNRFGVTYECGRETDEETDGRTGILVANGALNYTTRPKTPWHNKTALQSTADYPQTPYTDNVIIRSVCGS